VRTPCEGGGFFGAIDVQFFLISFLVFCVVSV